MFDQQSPDLHKYNQWSNASVNILFTNREWQNLHSSIHMLKIPQLELDIDHSSDSRNSVDHTMSVWFNFRFILFPFGLQTT